MRPSKTPTLDKMLAIKNESHVIGEFLKWLEENGCEIASYDGVALREPAHKLAAALAEPSRIKRDRDLLIPVNLSIERILAMYFKIDLDKAERERRYLLASLRAAQRRNHARN